MGIYISKLIDKYYANENKNEIDIININKDEKKIKNYNLDEAKNNNEKKEIENKNNILNFDDSNKVNDNKNFDNNIISNENNNINQINDYNNMNNDKNTIDDDNNEIKKDKDKNNKKNLKNNIIKENELNNENIIEDSNNIIPFPHSLYKDKKENLTNDEPAPNALSENNIQPIPTPYENNIEINYDNLGDDFSEEEEKNIKLKLHILVKNLEAKNVDIENLVEQIETIFNDLYNDFNNDDGEDINNKLEKIKNDMIKKYYELLVDKLKLKNLDDLKSIKKILLIIYKQNNNINIFKDYLLAVIENVNNFNNLSKENEIILSNYIINYLKSNELIKNKKEELKEKYKYNNIITFEIFTNIVKENNIAMDDKAIEYLIYKMKLGAIKDEKNLMETLDIKEFLDFFDKKVEEVENNTIKIGIRFIGPD